MEATLSGGSSPGGCKDVLLNKIIAAESCLRCPRKKAVCEHLPNVKKLCRFCVDERLVFLYIYVASCVFVILRAVGEIWRGLMVPRDSISRCCLGLQESQPGDDDI